MAVAVHFPVSDGFQAEGLCLGAFTDAVDGIHQEQPLALSRKSVAVHANPRGGRELHGDALGEFHFVVSRNGAFLVVVQREGSDLVQTRGEEEITEVGAAGTGKVGMAEPQDE